MSDLMLEYVIPFGQRALLLVLLVIAGRYSSRVFQSYSLPVRALAFVGGAAFLAGAIRLAGIGLMPCVYAFGIIAVLELLHKKWKLDASNTTSGGDSQ